MNVSSETNARRYPPSRPLLEVVRPNFFPGQSLSDRDLTALITWAEQRFRLEAACEDWGIACGLHVSVGQGGKPHVRISPGYGFNAARDLCVVSATDCGCGKSSPCHCTDQKPSIWCLPTPNGKSCGNNGSDDPVGVGYSTVKPSELAVFDLWVQPCHVKQQHALGLADNGNRNCQPSRYRVSAAVSYEYVSYQNATGGTEAPEDGISPAMKFLDSFAEVSPPKSGGTFAVTDVLKIREILAAQAKEYPELFGVTPPDLDGSIGKDLTEARLTEILSWLVFSLRRARHCCASNSKDQRIPLCRIWAKNLGQQYEVLWIDESAPYRRSLRCQPRAFRTCDWIGETFEAAQIAAKFAQVDLQMQATDFGTLATTRTEIATWLKAEADISNSDSVAKLLAICVSPRPSSHPIVVGFKSA